MLCCAVLCCAVLCCAVLCCAVLYCTVLYCTVQYNSVQCSIIQNSTVEWSTVQHSTVQHSTAQHSTAQNSTAQHSTERYINVLTSLGTVLSTLYPLYLSILLSLVLRFLAWRSGFVSLLLRFSLTFSGSRFASCFLSPILQAKHVLAIPFVPSFFLNWSIG